MCWYMCIICRLKLYSVDSVHLSWEKIVIRINHDVAFFLDTCFWFYLVMCELLPFSPLWVKASINETVLPDLFFFIYILGPHFKDVAHSLCQLLVHSEQSLHLCWIRPRQGPEEPLHALHHGSRCLPVQLSTRPGWQGHWCERSGGARRCGGTRGTCWLQRWAGWFLLYSRCGGQIAVPIRLWGEPVGVHGWQFFPVVRVWWLWGGLGARASWTPAMHRSKTRPIFPLARRTRLPITHRLPGPTCWSTGPRPVHFKQWDAPQRDTGDRLAEKGWVCRPVSEGLLQPTHVQWLGGHAN